MSTPYEIVDMHIHAGDFFRLRDDIQDLLTKHEMEPGVSLPETFSRPKVLEKYLRSSGVTRAIVIAECGPGTNFSIDSKLVADFSRDSEFFIPFGNVNPNYHQVPIDEWARSVELGCKGFKFYPADHGFNPLRPDMMTVYERCMSVGIPVMFHTGFTAQRDADESFIQPKQFSEIAESFAELPLILAHAGKPFWYEDAFDMAEKFENVFVDTALVPPVDIIPLLQARPHLANKVLFGSDWPVCGNYSQTLMKYRNAQLSDDVLIAVLGGNATHLLESKKGAQAG